MAEENFYSDAPQAKWNFDGAESEAIFQLKSNFVLQMDHWDLESAFWTVRSIRRELDAKLERKKKKIIEDFEKEQGKEKSKTEKQEVDEKLNELQELRLIWMNNPEKQKINFYVALEEFYMHICYLMKKHGLYFREGDDSPLAVLRR